MQSLSAAPSPGSGGGLARLAVSIVAFLLQSHAQYSISRLGQSAQILQHVWLLLITGPKPPFRSFLSPNKLLFSSGQQRRSEERLAKHGLFIRLNSPNGPHCLEEFDFLPFCVSVVCPRSTPPRRPAAALIASTQGVWKPGVSFCP